MIEVQDLTKYYGKKLAVEAVSFSIAEGEVAGLLGPNGAGKSTIMRVLTGFLPLTSGSAAVAGFDLMQNPLEVKKVVGYLPEIPPLYVEMTVHEFLFFAARLKLVPRPRQAAAVSSVITRCGLAEMAGRRIDHLSKGYRQRVGIAQAIVHDPKVIILDEPTAGLDPQQVQEVRLLIQELAQTMTVLISSHILSEIEAVCDKAVVINRGRLKAVDTVEHLKMLHNQAKTVFHLTFRGAAGRVLTQLQSLTEVSELVEEVGQISDATHCRITCEPTENIGNAIANVVIKNGGNLLRLTPEQFSLERVFLELTKEGPDL